MYRRKLTYAFLITLMVLGGASAWNLRNRSLPPDQRDTVQNRVLELRTEAQASGPVRGVLRGEPQPGNAWAEYSVALRDVGAWDDGERATIYLFATGVGEADRTVVEAVVARRASTLEHLRLGAQRADGRYYTGSGSRDWLGELPNSGASGVLIALAAAQSKLLIESEKPQEAANILLDMTAFARDLTTNSPLHSSLTGFEAYRQTFGAFRVLIQSAKLSPPELESLGKKLAIVDKEFPTLTSIFAFENLPFGESLLAPNSFRQTLEDADRLAQEDWRFVVAPLTTKVEAFEEKEKLLKRIAPLDGMTYTEARDEAEAILKDAKASPNKLVESVMPNVARALLTHREMLTRLRLLRAGVDVLRHGKMPAIADPFGDTLQSVHEDGKTTIWSAGRELANRFGRGNWTANPYVLELDKTRSAK